MRSVDAPAAAPASTVTIALASSVGNVDADGSCECPLLIATAIRRWLQTTRRVKNWHIARGRFRRDHVCCAFCGAKNSNFLVAAFRRLIFSKSKNVPLEVHDVYPYHCVENPELKSVEWWYGNYLLMCGHDHLMQGHCGDPACLDYNPLIRELARSVTDARNEYKTRC